jgi:hypothetical protein
MPTLREVGDGMSPEEIQACQQAIAGLTLMFGYCPEPRDADCFGCKASDLIDVMRSMLADEGLAP